MKIESAFQSISPFQKVPGISARVWLYSDKISLTANDSTGLAPSRMIWWDYRIGYRLRDDWIRRLNLVFLDQQTRVRKGLSHISNLVRSNNNNQPNLFLTVMLASGIRLAISPLPAFSRDSMMRESLQLVMFAAKISARTLISSTTSWLVSWVAWPRLRTGTNANMAWAQRKGRGRER